MKALVKWGAAIRRPYKTGWTKYTCVGGCRILSGQSPALARDLMSELKLRRPKTSWTL